ncbi:MAG: phosphoenolpyruvate--protein phosphotransferase [Polyangia bacterium]
MTRDHSKLICDIGELTALFTGTASLDGLLQNIVEMIALHMDADVCSIYLYYEESQELVLRATVGLAASSIGNVRLKSGEGLTGYAFQELRPVVEGDAARNPKFRYFAGIGEEPFASFVAIPILRGQTRVGAMTLQSEKKNYFTAEDVNIFRAITSQLATTIEMAKLLFSIERANVPPARVKAGELKLVKGRVGAEGFAYGEASVTARPSWDDSPEPQDLPPMTLQDLQRAVNATEAELQELQGQVEEKLFDVAALIFTAQTLMLKDRSFLGAMEEKVKQGTHPVYAVRSVVREYAGRFARMSNDYIREKQYDVMDVGFRLLENLSGRSDGTSHLAGKIVIARELLPSEALKLGSQKVAGLVMLSGGVTSHVAVLARSLNIVLVIAGEAGLLDLPEGTRLLIDGSTGNLFVNPEPEVVSRFREREEVRRAAVKAAALVRAETVTSDGTRLHLMANINLLSDAAVALDYHAEGVGLYRTEFPFIVRSDFPTEEEQFLIYRRLIEMMQGREVTFRTLDIGGDKVLSYYDHSKEANPFLGLRSIRFSLRHKEIFSQQIRAILRAAGTSAGERVRIMFPMISSVDEFIAAKGVVTDCLKEVATAGVRHVPEPAVGMMVEIPSAVEVIEDLAREAAFFSIGTNDLIQYTLAIDRTNEDVADLYLPHHPAVLRAIKRVAEVVLRCGREVSVCGDMAHDPRYVPFLAGVGIRTFSLDARYIPRIQQRLNTLRIADAEAHARDVLGMSRVGDIRAALAAME